MVVWILIYLLPGFVPPRQRVTKYILARVDACIAPGCVAIVFLQVVDGAEWLYKEPLLAPEAVSRMSRAVEKRSRAMGPSSRL